MDKKVKETAEELLIKIIDYIDAAEADEDEKMKLYLELACSLVTLTADMNKDLKELLNDINESCLHLRDMAATGTIRYKTGDSTNVRREWGK